MLVYLSLALAAAAFALAAIAHRSPRAPAKPFWMGEWPPAPGYVLDAGYRYDHLPFDFALPGQRFPLHDGSWMEILQNPAARTGQQPESPRHCRAPAPAGEEAARHLAELVLADREYDVAHQNWDIAQGGDLADPSEELRLRFKMQYEAAIARRAAVLARIGGDA